MEPRLKFYGWGYEGEGLDETEYERVSRFVADKLGAEVIRTPQPDGSLKGERVAKNLAALAGDDPDAWLIQLLHEYVGFAMFQAESLLTRDAERELAVAVNEVLKPVRPLDSPPGPPSRKSDPEPASMRGRAGV